MRRSFAGPLAATFLFATTALTQTTAQSVLLPHGTGHLQPDATWTVLSGEQLAAPSRASDPAAGFGRALLLATITDLQAQKRTGEHVVLHQPGGKPDELRLVNAYASDVATTVAELQAEASLAKVRDAMLAALQKNGITATFVGHEDPKLWASGSVRLRFGVTQNGIAAELEHHLVPAGERLQYFEVLRLAGDDAGRAATDALLRTFDGARVAVASIQNMLIGGALGAIAGMAMARWRRARLERALTGGAPPR